MRALVAGLIMMIASGCTNDGPRPYEPRPRVASNVPTVTYTIPARTPFQATSPDGRFHVNIDSNDFESGITLTINEGVSPSAAPVSLSKAYQVLVDPPFAPINPVVVDFAVSRMAIAEVGPVNFGVIRSPVPSGPVAAVLVAIHDPINEEIYAATGSFSTFQLVDRAAYYRCDCDITNACEPGCGFCDPDCSNCYCDITNACENCPCDLDCACDCDTSAGCDDGCECDRDCAGCECDRVIGPCEPSCLCDIDCDGFGAYPYPGCNGPADCISGMCLGGFCVDTCNLTTCSPGFRCIELVCFFGCETSDDCFGYQGADCCVNGACKPGPYCDANPPPEWNCSPGFHAGGDGCDCGCGAIDPDCEADGCAEPDCYDPACSYCYDATGQSHPCPTP